MPDVSPEARAAAMRRLVDAIDRAHAAVTDLIAATNAGSQTMRDLAAIRELQGRSKARVTTMMETRG